ncbi:MAG: energy-coupling factor transporter ATPase [bacterium]|nr:energy-coupling factor transporter ATPase [bacterium]
MSSIIEIKNLSFAYGDGDDGIGETVLDGISLEIEEGSFTAVLGRNGCGKSTLAKHFNCINLPSGGSVCVLGMDTADEKNLFRIRSQAGMVFQNPDNQMVAALVEDEVAFAPENLGLEPEEIRRRVDEALETVGMSEYALRPSAGLSGGQKQRVAIAGVLAMKPKLIILDEATAMLDPKGRKEVMSAVTKINRMQGAAVVHITHYMEEAALADRVIVMDGGRIIMDDTPRRVFSRTEELKAVGLNVPQVTYAAHELKKAGINIRTDVLTVEELYRELTALRK